jgi:hypothetical protein
VRAIAGSDVLVVADGDGVTIDDARIALADVVAVAACTTRVLAATATTLYELADGAAIARASFATAVVAIAATSIGAVVAIADGNIYEVAWSADGTPVFDVLPYCGVDRTSAVAALTTAGDRVRVLDHRGVIRELAIAISDPARAGARSRIG